MSFYISLLHWLPIRSDDSTPSGESLPIDDTHGVFGRDGSVTGRRIGLEHADSGAGVGAGVGAVGSGTGSGATSVHEGLVGPQGFSGDPRAPGTAPGPFGAYGMPGGDYAGAHSSPGSGSSSVPRPDLDVLMSDLSAAAEGAGAVLAEWALAFLDRLFSMLEAQEAPAKLADGAGECQPKIRI